MSWRTLFLVALLMLAGAAGWFWQALQQPVHALDDSVSVVVQPGETPGGVLRRLDADGQLDYSLPLRVWLRLQPQNDMQAGEYELVAGMTAAQLLDRLLAGAVVQRGFTIIDGWSIQQLRAALRAEIRLRQETPELTDTELMALLGEPGLHPEGRFAPDTYFFAAYSTSDLEILQRALKAQSLRLAEAWASRAEGLPYSDPAQLLTMASIVEKETGQPNERADIAGVFVRRMQIGMRLQTDPTVIYGLGENYRGNITRAHLQARSPYNTYLIDGLPPTPIAMPGKAALAAAAHPAAGGALYFVGRGDGSHQFSATLEAHNAAVREYQLRRRGDYRSAPSP